MEKTNRGPILSYRVGCKLAPGLGLFLVLLCGIRNRLSMGKILAR